MIGIIANPSSGKDIRRLVSQGTVFDNLEKVNIIQRILYVLHCAGISEISMMPDAFCIGERALTNLWRNLKIEVDLEMLDIEFNNNQDDSSQAAELLCQKGASCIITLGGDGTNRAVAKKCGQVPLIPISTGTNNVFPYMLEGTIAGLVAVIAEKDHNKSFLQTETRKKINIYKNDQWVDMALIDAVVTSDRFIGARALWKPESIMELVVTEASIGSLGMSAIAGSFAPVLRDAEEGIYLTLHGAPQLAAWVPIMPGIITPVEVSSYRKISAGERIRVKTLSGMIALDGEREVAFNEDDKVDIVLSLQGPNVIKINETLEAAVKGNFFTVDGGGSKFK